MKLQFIGGGKMAEALLGGLLAAGWADADELAVVEKLEQRRAELTDRYPELAVGDRPIAGTDAVIAVKPNDVADILGPLRDGNTRRVLSIAAGVTIGALEAGLADGASVVRAMPNTPALVGRGASAIAGGANVDADDLDWADGILSSVGLVVRLDEAQLDPVTGLSGSGPAYVFLVAEAMMAAGEGVGLAPAVSEALTTQTLLGAATLLAESADPPDVLRANVTSPGGTTAEGLAVLEAAGIRDDFARAIRAATDRSVELGRG